MSIYIGLLFPERDQINISFLRRSNNPLQRRKTKRKGATFRSKLSVLEK